MVKSGQVTTEGDVLYYEVRGEGAPILMIDCRMDNRPMDIVPLRRDRIF